MTIGRGTSFSFILHIQSIIKTLDFYSPNVFLICSFSSIPAAIFLFHSNNSQLDHGNNLITNPCSHLLPSMHSLHSSQSGLLQM